MPTMLFVMDWATNSGSANAVTSGETKLLGVDVSALRLAASCNGVTTRVRDTPFMPPPQPHPIQPPCVSLRTSQKFSLDANVSLLDDQLLFGPVIEFLNDLDFVVTGCGFFRNQTLLNGSGPVFVASTTPTPQVSSLVSSYIRRYPMLLWQTADSCIIMNPHTPQTQPGILDLYKTAAQQAARLFQEGRLHECHLLVSQLIKADPNNDDAQQIAGLLKLRSGDSHAAIPYLESATEINPANADHYNNLALGYGRIGRYKDAISVLETGIRIAPSRPILYTNLAVQLRNLANSSEENAFRRDELIRQAEEALNTALVLNPQQIQAHVNLGSLNAERHKMDEAEKCYLRALEIDPTQSSLHVDLSYVYFLKGEWDKAWPHYEHRRWHYPQSARWESIFPPARRWVQGIPLEEKTLCVFCEQGCGDALHFARYLTMFDKNRLVIYCHDPLVRLMSQFGEAYPFSGKVPPHDLAVSIMSLPNLVGETSRQPYLTATRADTSSYDHTFKIGLCWAGNPQHPGDRFRSIPLSKFAGLKMADVTLFSLQKDYRPRKYHDAEEVVDLCKSGPKMIDLSASLTDFEDTARFIMSMDLVITVDTAVLHLAGTLGKETWALIPFNPDWRWGLTEPSTPLYSNVTLFRQPAKHDWNTVLADISCRLQERLKCKYTTESATTPTTSIECRE